jgi:hypothetical protein
MRSPLVKDIEGLAPVICEICDQEKPRYQSYRRCKECQLDIRRRNYVAKYRAIALPKRRAKRGSQTAETREYRSLWKRTKRNASLPIAWASLRADETVYFVRDGDLVKIGFTTKPVLGARGRLRELQCGNPRPLELLTQMNGPRLYETSLHDRFRAHRVAGAAREWFYLAPEIQNFIDEVKARSIEPCTSPNTKSSRRSASA